MTDFQITDEELFAETDSQRKDRERRERFAKRLADEAVLSRDKIALSLDNAAELEPSTYKPFPVSLLPGFYGDFAKMLAKSLQTPPDLAAVIILGCVSAALGKGLEARFCNYRTRGNVYLLIGADSGTGKSETGRVLSKVFETYEKARTESWLRNVFDPANAEREILESDRKAVLNQRDRDDRQSALAVIDSQLRELNQRQQNPFRLQIEDASAEAFVQRLSMSNGCGFSFSLEAGRVIQNLFGRMSGDGVQVDDSYLLNGYSGDRIQQDRISRDAPTVEDPCVSLLWLVTPRKLEPVVTDENLLEGGFVGRCLCAMFQFPEKKLSPNVLPIHEADQARYDHGIIKLLDTFRFAQQPHQTSFAPDAVTLLIDHQNTIADRINAGQLIGIENLARRWTECAARMALILHAMKEGEKAGSVPVTGETAFEAIAVTTWFTDSQEVRMRQQREDQMDAKTKKALDAVRLNARLNGYIVTAQNLYRRRKGWGKICNNAEEAFEVLTNLTVMGFLVGPSYRVDRSGRDAAYFVVKDLSPANRRS